METILRKRGVSIAVSAIPGERAWAQAASKLAKRFGA